jgi:hypothetical protein
MLCQSYKFKFATKLEFLLGYCGEKGIVLFYEYKNL